MVTINNNNITYCSRNTSLLFVSSLEESKADIHKNYQTQTHSQSPTQTEKASHK